MNRQQQKEKRALLGSESVEYPQASSCFCKRSIRICLFPLVLVAIAVACGLILSCHFWAYEQQQAIKCNPKLDSCIISLVESIPQNLTYTDWPDEMHVSTAQALLGLIGEAKDTIEIASYYWSLRGSDIAYHDNTSKEGDDLFAALLNAGKNRNITVKIVQNIPSPNYPQNDTIILAKEGKAQVRSINFTKLIGDGILHTKMWMIDRKHFYVGSANLDWRSMTQVKELGVTVKNCSCLAHDMAKIFDVYWLLALPGVKHVPTSWPKQLYTTINANNTAHINYNKTEAQVYLSSSPPKMCPPGRTVDIDAILNVIHQAQEFIYIAVMDYFPTTLYTKNRVYWPVIDDALREAALNRGVKVRLMPSWWNHTRPDMLNFLNSFQALYDYEEHVFVQVKLFQVPAFTEAQRQIPFCRVNHNKYMVTDQHAYIGTSNWSADYFNNTGGIGFVLRSLNHTVHDLRYQLRTVFERDWHSIYAVPLTNFTRT